MSSESEDFNALAAAISVSGVTEIKASPNRVLLTSNAISYTFSETDIIITTVVNIDTLQSRKRLTLRMKKNIQPGVYSVGTPESPVQRITYTEYADLNGLEDVIDYAAINGLVTIQAATSDQLYRGDYKFTGRNSGQPDLDIEGTFDIHLQVRPI